MRGKMWGEKKQCLVKLGDCGEGDGDKDRTVLG